ncbi:MAG: hypothetical protein WCH34_02270 [Bacteroidota bacterium]
MQNRYKFLILTVVLLYFSLGIKAQTRISSPYSVYGLGEISSTLHTRYMSMGGTSLGFQSAQTINYMNPASYVALDTLSFVFEGAMTSVFSTQTSLVASQSGNYASLSYLLFGFPITKWWKSSIGLLPFSNMGYKITDSQTIDSVGKVNYVYEGQGGINQVYWGNAISISQGFSFGMNAAYLFGSLDKIRSVLFPESLTAYNTRLYSSTEMSGFLLSFGTQYFKKISEKYTIGIGATFSNATNVSTKSSYMATSFTQSTSGYTYVKDTIENTSGVKSTLTLPMTFGVGASLRIANKYEVGSDFKWQNWGNYQNNQKIDTLQNSWQISAGAQILPASNATNYLSRAFYRFGFRYGKTYLQLKDNQLSEWAISAGLGLPLRKTKSTINIGIEYSQRGTTANDLIKESFTKISLGVSINERWFVRRKFF